MGRGIVLLLCLWSVFQASTLLAQPSLVFPKQGTVINQNPSYFGWNSAEAGTSYRLMVSNSAAFSTLIVDETLTANTYIPAVQIPAGSYFWKVESTFEGSTLVSNVYTFNIVHPQDEPGLVFWTNADNSTVDGNNRVSALNDLSPASNHVLQATITNQPLRVANAINAQPVIRFDGNDRLQTAAATQYNSPNSMLIIWRSATAGQGFAFDGQNVSGSNSIYWSTNEIRFWANPRIQYSKTAPFAYVLNAGSWNGSNSVLYENGILKASGNAGTNPLNGLKVGMRFDNTLGLNGDIAEIMLFNNAIASDKRQLYENFLRQKYTPLVDLGLDIIPNIGQCPVSLGAGPRFVSFLWNTGATTESIAVTESGTYWVTATDLFGYASTDTVRVSFPEFSITASDPSFCLTGSNVLTANLPGGDSFNVTWNTTAQGAAITINESGSYSYQAIGSGGCKYDSEVLTFDGFANEYTLGPDIDACTGEAIIAIPAEEAEGYTFQWSDGTFANQTNVQAGGTYEVEVTNPNGCVATDAIEVNVIGVAPSVEIVLPAQVCAMNEYNFAANIQSSGGDDVIGWLWNFGDGIESLEESPLHTYANAGDYTIQLTVTTQAGCTNFDAALLTTDPSPIPAFEVLTGCVEVPLQFNDASEAQGGFEITGWAWDFDNGTLSNLPNPLVSYAEAGNYNVQLTVTAANGCSRATEQLLEVVDSAAPPEAFSIYMPANGITLSGSLVSVAFNASANADFYIVQASTNADFTNIILETTVFNADPLLLNLFPGSYHLRIIASNFCAQEVISPSVAFQLIDISQQGALFLNYNGDNVVMEGGNVASILDQSGNGYHTAQANVNFRPQRVFPEELNGLPAIRFDGTNDRMLVNFGTTYPQPVTAFALWKIESSTTNHFLFDGATPTERMSLYYSFNGQRVSILSNPTNFFGYAATIPFAQPILNTVFYNDASSSIRKNSLFQISGNTGNLGLSGLTIGNIQDGSSSFLNGYFGEILLYQGILNSETSSQIENYLMDKYAPPANLGADIHIPYGFCGSTIDAGARFVSYLWSTGETSQTIEVLSTGTYSVTAVDIFGRSSTDAINVTFPGNFLNDDFAICIGDTFIYDTELTLDGYTFLWNTDDETPSISISEGGQFSVTVNDTIGCSYTSPIVTATIDSFPVTAALEQLPTFCLGNTLFLSSGFEEAQTYLWSTDETTPFITPQTSGAYWVEALNANGCVGRDTVEVDIVGIAPTAAYTVTAPCAATELTFADATVPEGSIVTAWNWDFGVSTATTPVATATFPTVGAYPIALTVTLENGCTGTLRDTVQVNHLPLVNFTAPVVCAGTEVIYESVSAVPGGVPITSWEWSFSNGSTDSGLLGNTTFENTGAATVSLTVVSAQGCTDSLTRNIEVLGSPVPDFNFSTVCIGAPTLFTENVDESESGPVFYNWQFGNGFFSNFPNTSHLYSNPGVYTVTLTATGNNGGLTGCVASITREVPVFSAPNAVVNLQGACVGEDALLTDLTEAVSLGGYSDAIATRTWQVDGVLSGNDSVLVYPAAVTGIFPAALFLTTEAGCVASGGGAFEVKPVPEAFFEISLPIAAPPYFATGINTSTNAEMYAWFQDGDFIASGGSVPDFYFPDTGTYIIELAAINSFGCNDTASFTAVVIVPEYDLEVLALEATENGGRLSLKAAVRNNGNVRVDAFTYEVQVGLETNLRSEAMADIAPGTTEEFTVPGNFYVSTAYTMPYVCLGVSNPNGILNNTGGFSETDLTNNQICAGLTRSGPVYVPPYPNPATGDLNLGIILPEKAELTLEIFDSMGKRVRSFTLSLEKGYTLYTIPVYDFSEGMYLIRYETGGDVQTVRFVVGI